MAHYMIQVAYTPEALATLINKPRNRIAAVSKAIEQLGGKVHGGWFCFGEYDVVIIYELANNVSAAAFAVAVAAGGATKANKTTPLLTPNEMVKMLKKAGQSGYKPPR